ncbi:Uncharacterised protein [Vibrio cholerae]|nr:Uncharacterised protein [Vibrio cholerae]
MRTCDCCTVKKPIATITKPIQIALSRFKRQRLTFGLLDFFGC